MIWAKLKVLLGGAGRWWLLWLALVAVAAIMILRAAEDADDRRNQDLGAAAQRARDLAETLHRTEEGNAAREEIRAPGPAGDRARYDQCLRAARTAANCQRFLPE